MADIFAKKNKYMKIVDIFTKKNRYMKIADIFTKKNRYMKMADISDEIYNIIDIFNMKVKLYGR